MTEEWREYFSEYELTCHCGKCVFDVSKINAESLAKLVAMRKEAGFPFPVSSSYRCSRHPAEAGKSATGTHPEGRGWDIRVSHINALKLLALAPKHGFKGIGVNQKGPVDQRFIHVDDGDATSSRPRPHIWSY